MCGKQCPSDRSLGSFYTVALPCVVLISKITSWYNMATEAPAIISALQPEGRRKGSRVGLVLLRTFPAIKHSIYTQAKT